MKQSVLVHALEEDIIRGRYGISGSVFPTLNTITTIYDVSLMTATRAVHILTDSGILAQHGKHFYITSGYVESTTPYGVILRKNTLPVLGLDLNAINNPFFSHLADLFTDEAKRHGYSLIVQSSGNDQVSKLANLKTFRSLNVSGIFVVPDINTDNLDSYRFCPLPLVILGRRTNLPNRDVVVVENESSGSKVAAHLVKMACKSFVYVGLDNFISIDYRLHGFRTKLNELGKQLDQVQTVTGASDKTLRSKILPLIRDLPKPIGIFCYHDLLAVEVTRAVKKSKNGQYRIPDDVCVVGFDNLPIASIINPPLTTVSYRYDRIVEQAMSQMLDHIHNPDHVTASISISCSLTIRESSSRIPIQ